MQQLQALLLIVAATPFSSEERILVGRPQYVCKEGAVVDTQRNSTQIQLFDEAGLTYAFKILYRGEDEACRGNQRCTVRNWELVRGFNRVLDEGAKGASVEFSNRLIEPGLQYFVTVSGLRNGAVVKRKELTIDFITEAEKREIQKPECTIKLVGPPESFVYIDYFVSAELSLCVDSSYYITWRLISANDDTPGLDFAYKGLDLIIPKNTLLVNKTYRIQVKVFNLDKKLMAQEEKELTTMSRGVLVRIPVKRQVVNAGQLVAINAIVRNFDNLPGLQVEWTCHPLTNGEQCTFNPESEIESAFPTPGQYRIGLSAGPSSDWCLIDVQTDAPTVEFAPVDAPLNPLNGLELRAQVYNLGTFCSLEWLSRPEDGYEFLDLAQLPGGAALAVNVTTTEDLFLHELVEPTHGKLQTSHNLRIPGPSQGWPGLKGDARYLLQLLITCPVMNGSHTYRKTSQELVIETNEAPLIARFDVSPGFGEALRTKFTFKCQTAAWNRAKGPILYKFGYFIRGKSVVLRKTLGENQCRLTLPYTELGVGTFVECCDSLDGCRRAQGPVIKTNRSEANKQGVLTEFSRQLLARDYDQAFATAFGALESFPGDLQVHDAVFERISAEIDAVMAGSDRKRDLNSANNLISSFIYSGLELPETIVDKLVEFQGLLSEEFRRRPKRSIVQINETRNYIELAELIIVSSKEAGKVEKERENLRGQVVTYMEQLCLDLKKSEVRQEFKTFILSVEKLSKNSLNRFVVVPFEDNTWGTTARVKFGTVVLFKGTKQKCLGKAVFRDHLQKPGYSFFIDVINAWETVDFGEIVVYLPKNHSLSGKPTCVMYRDGWQHSCKLVQNLANYVQCSCKNLGYYALDYVPAALPSTAPVTDVETATEPGFEWGNATSAISIEQSTKTNNYDLISYIVVGVSLTGIIIITVILRRIFNDDDDKEETETFDFPKYAQLYDEEYLNDAHI